MGTINAGKPKGVRARTNNKNVLESLRDIGTSAANSVKEDLVKPVGRDFVNQMMYPTFPQRFSGEISKGESVEMKDIYSGKRQQIEGEKRQLAAERRLFNDEKARVESKTRELRLQLAAVMQELASLSQGTQELAEEAKIASMQAPVEPGVYHIIFFQKILEFVKNFRKKIENATSWLSEANARANKKNYWSRYKKHGSKFLLSGEHYLTRSAG